MYVPAYVYVCHSCEERLHSPTCVWAETECGAGQEGPLSPALRMAKAGPRATTSSQAGQHIWGGCALETGGGLLRLALQHQGLGMVWGNHGLSTSRPPSPPPLPFSTPHRQMGLTGFFQAGLAS